MYSITGTGFSSQISYLINQHGFGLNVFQVSTLVSLNNKCFFHNIGTYQTKKHRHSSGISIALSCIAFIKTFFVLLLLSDLSIFIFSRCLSYFLLMAS